MVALSGRPRPELADILEEHAPLPINLGRDRRRAIRDIVLCRTPILGGHLQVCDHCGREQPFYNSCRNRHCPKCQSLDQARWVAAQSQHLLPVPYFHVVFTVPPALHPLFLNDRRRSFQMLFAAAGETLNDVCRRRLGATPGVIAVLHTWTQTLRFHPHVHCIVTGGGLSLDRQRWIASRSNFFLPVRVLSKVFKGKLLHRFETALVSSVLHTPVPFGRQRLRQAASTPWVVYSKAPMAGPEQVLRYLGRYTHRIALGNERIVDLHDGQVTFRYRNRRRGNRTQLRTLPAPEFVQLFLLHVLSPTHRPRSEPLPILRTRNSSRRRRDPGNDESRPRSCTVSYSQTTSALDHATRRSWCTCPFNVATIQPPGSPLRPTPATGRPLAPGDQRPLASSQHASRPPVAASTSVQSTYLLEPAV